MNFHPKDNDNLSLVSAVNVKLANDESCITNEESIKENTFIKNSLRDYYNNNDYSIISIIPCNTELIIISVKNTTPTKAQIFRYKEATLTNKESMICAYGNKEDKYLEYHGGKIKGTFTYNVENSLIIAIAEYDGNVEKIPLRTINLGNFTNDNVFNDKELPNKALSIAPEVYIPSMRNIKYIKGNTYKGWYYLFIRFKINSVDYTQWYNFGFPIFIDSLEKYAITKYCYRQKITNMERDSAANIVSPEEPIDGFCAGASDYFSSTSDIANETFKIDINFNHKNNIYSKYQIGIICSSKKYTKAFRTSDINFNWNGDNDYVEKFILNNASLIEASASEFIIDNYNYFDVKNIINYQNRLYISNYKEGNANDENIIKSKVLDNINIDLIDNNVIYGSPVSYDYTISSKDKIGNFNNQYEANVDTKGETNGISAESFFNLKGEDSLYIDGDCDVFDKTGKTSSHITGSFKIKDINIIESSSEFYINDNGVTQSIRRTFLLPSHIAIMVRVNTPVSPYRKETTIYKFNKIVSINNDNPTESSLNSPVTTINCEDYAINGGVNYINVNKSFNNRKVERTLIPGEVYNFFIHFVDKYGHCTNGYRIENKTVWTTEDDTSTEIIPIPFTYNGVTYYAAIPVNANLLVDLHLNIEGIKIYNNIDTNSSKLISRYNNDTIINKFKIIFSNFENNKYENVKWFQIASGYSANKFLPYYNNNGDKLFKVPIKKHPTDSIEKYLFDVKGVTIPKGYVGWFISYEKFEPIKRITGVLTRNDFRSQDSVTNWLGHWYDLNTANCHKSDLMYFFSGQFDISDSIRLDYNLMRIDAINVWDKNDIPNWDYNQRSHAYKFCHDMNKPQVSIVNKEQLYEFNIAPTCYAMPEYKLAVADSASDNRMGLGTALQIKDSYNLFPNYAPSEENNDKIKLYKVTLFNANRDIYMSTNKTLIRCTNIIYDTTIDNSDKFVNGFMTYDGCLIYENSGFNFNTANNIAYRTWLNTKFYTSDADNKHTYEINAPFMAYMQFPCVADYFYESKCFKNKPTGYVFYVKQDKDNLDKANENNKFATGCIVTPANSIDLFENPQSSSDVFNPKSYTNYREDLVSVDNYNKTIRRSSVIQDETRINSWRNFPIEGYKNISENKGIITNLVGIGTVLLVHTEHSLFIFDTSSNLETKDKSIQLTQPDAFDVKYKEVFTSSLGYGGLQDDKAFIVDQFGYMFYNNDFHRFYNFDNGQLNFIDDDIIQWLDKYKPYNVRFGNDKFNNRILIRMNYKNNDIEKEVVFSYNYNAKHFVSTHSYTFSDAINTKSKLYLKCDDNQHNNCSLHQFIQDGSSYGSFDNTKNKIGIDTTVGAKIGIIINEHYDEIKYLESISYKLTKLSNSTEIDYTYSPVEEAITPYSADYLKVYNNEVNTGRLNVLIDDENNKNKFCNYTKPYWEFGNWNYNYLRNNISKYAKYGDAFNMSRIFGNYFIVEFTFSNSDNLKVEFEELKYNIV